MGVVEQLKQDGIEKGLCRLWQRKLTGDMDMSELSELYIKGIDFCISEDYPTLEYLRTTFKGECEPYGIYIDDDVDELKNASDAVFNGDCKAFLEYDGFAVSRVFARHNTKASVNVSDNAIVTIDAFDNSVLVVAVSGDNAQAIVNLYGNAKVEAIGMGITVNYMNKNTY